MIRIDYEKKVEKYFKDDFELMKSKIGIEKTKSVKKIINRLKASNSFYVFVQLRLGNPHPLSGSKKEYYAVNVTANYRLIVRPVTESFSIEDLKKCDTVVVKGVEEYHGGKDEWIIP